MTGEGKQDHTHQAIWILMKCNGGDAMLWEYDGSIIDTEAAADVPRRGQLIIIS